MTTNVFLHNKLNKWKNLMSCLLKNVKKINDIELDFRSIISVVSGELKTASGSGMASRSTKVVVDGKRFSIKWQAYLAAMNEYNFVALQTSSCGTNASPPGWGGWIVGWGGWGSASAMPYNTTVNGGGNWVSYPALEKWHTLAMEYDGQGKTAIYLDEVQKGTCTGNISGTYYLNVYVQGREILKDLELTTYD